MRAIRPAIVDFGRLVGRVRVHPLFLVLFVASWYAGLLGQCILLFLLVVLHELGHAFAANSLGYEVEKVSLLPFGGVAQLSYQKLAFQPRHEAIVAIAGPLVNLLLAVLAFLLSLVHLWSESFAHDVLQMNLWIVTFNLLPAMPLDGGRILRAARSRTIGYEPATREGYRLAFMLSVTLFLMGVIALWAGHPHLGMLILGIFLFASAVLGKRGLRGDLMRFLMAKRRQHGGGPLPIVSLAANRETKIRDVVVRFAPDRYHLIYVLDDGGQVVSILEEEEILKSVFEGRWMEPIDSILRPS